MSKEQRKIGESFSFPFFFSFLRFVFNFFCPFSRRPSLLSYKSWEREEAKNCLSLRFIRLSYFPSIVKRKVRRGVKGRSLGTGRKEKKKGSGSRSTGVCIALIHTRCIKKGRMCKKGSPPSLFFFLSLSPWTKFNTLGDYIKLTITKKVVVINWLL